MLIIEKTSSTLSSRRITQVLAKIFVNVNNYEYMDQKIVNIMTLFGRLYRNVRRLFLSPSVTLAILLVAAVCLYYNGEKLRLFYERLKIRLYLPDVAPKPKTQILEDGNTDGVQTISQDPRGLTSRWELRKGNVAVYAIQGGRPYMEDRFNVITSFEQTKTSIYGVFDGHGGEFAVEYTEKTLFKSIMVRLLRASLSGFTEDHGKLLVEEILAVDAKLLKLANATSEFSGCTALVSLLSQNILTVANVGDSRGVICDKSNKAVPLSFDHKPDQLREKRRIQQAGGFVSFNGVWRVSGILATSRALGDLPLKKHHLVIADADILRFDLTRLQPSFAIFATDGLWDVFSNDDAVSFIRQRLTEPHFGAKSLVREALSRGSLDNITVMIVDLRHVLNT